MILEVLPERFSPRFKEQCRRLESEQKLKAETANAANNIANDGTDNSNDTDKGEGEGEKA